MQTSKIAIFVIGSMQRARDFAQRIKKLACNNELKIELGLKGRKKILSNFSIQNVLAEKSEIYKGYMNEMEDILWAVH